MKNIEEKTFNTGNVTINFAEVPSSGPPLILLHGGGDRWQLFLPIIPHLAKKCHIYALDLRGHGKSGRIPGKYRPEHYVSDIVAFLDSLVAENVILFGHSLGGWIALLVAKELKDKVSGVILGDPPLNIERFLAYEGSVERIRLWRSFWALAISGLSIPELEMELSNVPVSLPGQDKPIRFGDLPGVDATYLKQMAETTSLMDPDVIQYHAEGRLDEYVNQVNLEMIFKSITCPMLLIQADPMCGGVVLDDDVKHTLSLLPDGQHVQLDGAGHDLGFSKRNLDPLIRILTNYLESF
jgi:pimeloyl-ACP methyl ester carboxylesterase